MHHYNDSNNGRKDDSDKLEMGYLGRLNTWSKFAPHEIPKHLLGALKALDNFWFETSNPTYLLVAIDELRTVVSLEAEIAVRKFGAEKYGLLNYRRGMKWSRLFGAARRHLYYYPLIKGETHDPDHGQLHEAGALCCISFLYEYATEGLGEDDRSKK